MSNEKASTLAYNMDRSEIETLLEKYDLQCDTCETTDELREALIIHLCNGSITL